MLCFPKEKMTISKEKPPVVVVLVEWYKLFSTAAFSILGCRFLASERNASTVRTNSVRNHDTDSYDDNDNDDDGFNASIPAILLIDTASIRYLSG